LGSSLIHVGDLETAQDRDEQTDCDKDSNVRQNPEDSFSYRLAGRGVRFGETVQEPSRPFAPDAPGTADASGALRVALTTLATFATFTATPAKATLA
jgi:hypothetical protein